MGDEELLEHSRRIAELERKVAALYEHLGHVEPQFGGGSGFDGGPVFASDLRAGPEADPRIAELLAAGNKIGAIKVYRELTGSGLKEAKDAVERIETSGPQSG